MCASSELSNAGQPVLSLRLQKWVGKEASNFVQH